MEYLNIGSSPVDESCAQVGTDNYRKQARLELNVLARQMRRIHPEPEDGSAYYSIKGFAHDFGTYHELVAMFDPDNEAACRWAYQAEELLPENWDAEALAELKEAGYEVRN